jgi:hypothetical protein
MKLAQKLGIAFLVGIALAASGFQGTTLATDNPPTSPSLHPRITRVPGGKVKSAKLAQENGQLIWSIDIVTPLTKKIAAVQVDARSGKVLSKLVQTPGDRAEESVGAQKKK